MPFNTPVSYAQKGYLTGAFPPGHRDPTEMAAVLQTVHTCDFEAALRLHTTGARVEGVMLWTAIDNYEWLSGFDVSFGLFGVDRSPRPSADFIRAVTGG